jgi:hypothetical protein
MMLKARAGKSFPEEFRVCARARKIRNTGILPAMFQLVILVFFRQRVFRTYQGDDFFKFRYVLPLGFRFAEISFELPAVSRRMYSASQLVHKISHIFGMEYIFTAPDLLHHNPRQLIRFLIVERQPFFMSDVRQKYAESVKNGQPHSGKHTGGLALDSGINPRSYNIIGRRGTHPCLLTGVAQPSQKSNGELVRNT